MYIPDFLLQPFRKPKRIRTAFSPTQLLKLEHAFEGNHYVVGAERKTLAQTLSLTETQVTSNSLAIFSLLSKTIEDVYSLYYKYLVFKHFSFVFVGGLIDCM